MENALSLLPVGVLKVAVIDEHTIKFEDYAEKKYSIKKKMLFLMLLNLRKNIPVNLKLD